MVKKIQNNNMDEALQAKAAVVDFSAVWCGPCQMLAPVLEELADDLDGKVAFYNADTDENTQLAIANGITNIPALLFLKDGKVAGKNVGFMPKPELEAWVKGCMERNSTQKIRSEQHMGFDEEHPLATIVESMLERTHPDYKETPDIKWNFTKFLIDRDGNVVERLSRRRIWMLYAKRLRTIYKRQVPE